MNERYILKYLEKFPNVKTQQIANMRQLQIFTDAMKD